MSRPTRETAPRARASSSRRSRSADRPYRIVFVCTGNICRSPMAEVITRSLADVHRARRRHHAGRPPRACAAPAPGPGTRASRCTRSPRRRWPGPATPTTGTWPTRSRRRSSGSIDLIVALDRRHQQTLRGLGADPDRLVLLRSFDAAAGAAADVPDPYYGDDAVFDECRDMIAAACAGLVASLADALGHPLGRLRLRPPDRAGAPAPRASARTAGQRASPPGLDRQRRVP